MNIIFNPPDNDENKYIANMVGPLREEGFKIFALDSFLSSLQHYRSIKLVHINWFENVDDSSFFIALRSFMRKLVVLLAIKLGNKKLVWTMHNRTSHETGLSFFSRTLMYLLIRGADKIIVHSKVSKAVLNEYVKNADRKAVYLPHPNFIGSYGPIPTVERADLEDKRLNLLFLGTIKPYKNIELLINIAKKFPSSVQLTIAGKPNSKNYYEKLHKLAQREENIHLALRFIADDEIPTILSASDLLVLPYDIKSSLNSGTVILAFSYKKSVICPIIGTISDLENEEKYVLGYLYNNVQEHEQSLMKSIERAIEMKSSDPYIFDFFGNHLFDYVQKYYNKELIGKHLSSIYKELLS
ncbi:glycosyltransferase [Olivibacter domesticus]|uniref:Glycosyltransferase involved in cell wall bisynthesis n=1 Tax=Olivibacter domesticus TaxID=407022 RepID=A0A1H7YTE2_OLID1|nr:glycosyltransferase [Olivibacter domesticus]SEM49486.1 Glycosyltransferase involved in cell wall bisynthesis [Olivibacter domesticus]